MAQNASPRAQNALKTLLSIPSGLGTSLEKIHFFRPGDPGGPTVGPNFARAVLPSRLHQVTTGTGVYASRWANLRLGKHKKWGPAGGLASLGIRF